MHRKQLKCNLRLNKMQEVVQHLLISPCLTQLTLQDRQLFQVQPNTNVIIAALWDKMDQMDVACILNGLFLPAVSSMRIKQ